MPAQPERCPIASNYGRGREYKQRAAQRQETSWSSSLLKNVWRYEFNVLGSAEQLARCKRALHLLTDCSCLAMLN